MEFLESLIDIYFFIFLTILPFTFIASTILYFINNKKNLASDEKLATKSKIIIGFFVVLCIISLISFALFVLFYEKVVSVIGSTLYYFVCFTLVLLTYLITSYIENLAMNPQKYMKIMSSNLKLSSYKDFLIRTSITQFIKVYVFICYLVAILLFQLENMKIYAFADGFIQTIVNVCNNTITIILAFELLINYKKQKKKEISGIKKGSLLFNTFFEFSIKYLEIYNWFTDNFVPILYKKDKVFYSKIPILKQSLEQKLEEIRHEKDYENIKVSPKIKTYDIAYDTLIECINNYLRDKQKTNDKKSYIVYMIMYFQKIIENEISIKTQKQYLKNVCKFANDYNKKEYSKKAVL